MRGKRWESNNHPSFTETDATRDKSRYLGDGLVEPRRYPAAWEGRRPAPGSAFPQPPAGADGWLTFELTRATSFDSVLAIYTGHQLDQLVGVAGNDDYGSLQNSRASFPVVGGTTYSLVVAGKSRDATKRAVSANQSGSSSKEIPRQMKEGLGKISGYDIY